MKTRKIKEEILVINLVKVPLWCNLSAVIIRKLCSFAMHKEFPNGIDTIYKRSPRSLSIANSRLENEKSSSTTPRRMPECNQTSKHCRFNGKQKQWQPNSLRKVKDSWCCRSIKCIMKDRELPNNNLSRCVEPSEARKIDSLLWVRIVNRFSEPPRIAKNKQINTMSSALKIFLIKIVEKFLQSLSSNDWWMCIEGISFSKLIPDRGRYEESVDCDAVISTVETFWEPILNTDIVKNN